MPPVQSAPPRVASSGTDVTRRSCATARTEPVDVGPNLAFRCHASAAMGEFFSELARRGGLFYLIACSGL